MSRIMEAWEQLLRDAVASDFDEQQMALFQIGLILQRHNPHITPETDMEEDALCRDLLRLTLNEQRQRDAVEYLAALAARNPKQADSIFTAMGNAQPAVLVPVLVKLLQDAASRFSVKALYHAVSALDAAYRRDKDAVIAVAQAHDVVGLLDQWVEHSDSLLADKAAFLADHLEEDLETNGGEED